MSACALIYVRPLRSTRAQTFKLGIIGTKFGMVVANIFLLSIHIIYSSLIATLF